MLNHRILEVGKKNKGLNCFNTGANAEAVYYIHTIIKLRYRFIGFTKQ